MNMISTIALLTSLLLYSCSPMRVVFTDTVYISRQKTLSIIVNQNAMNKQIILEANQELIIYDPFVSPVDSTRKFYLAEKLPTALFGSNYYAKYSSDSRNDYEAQVALGISNNNLTELGKVRQYQFDRRFKEYFVTTMDFDRLEYIYPLYEINYLNITNNIIVFDYSGVWKQSKYLLIPTNPEDIVPIGDIFPIFDEVCYTLVELKGRISD